MCQTNILSTVVLLAVTYLSIWVGDISGQKISMLIKMFPNLTAVLIPRDFSRFSRKHLIVADIASFYVSARLRGFCVSVPLMCLKFWRILCCLYDMVCSSMVLKMILLLLFVCVSQCLCVSVARIRERGRGLLLFQRHETPSTGGDYFIFAQLLAVGANFTAFTVNLKYKHRHRVFP